MQLLWLLADPCLRQNAIERRPNTVDDRLRPRIWPMSVIQHTGRFGEPLPSFAFSPSASPLALIALGLLELVPRKISLRRIGRRRGPWLPTGVSYMQAERDGVGCPM